MTMEFKAANASQLQGLKPGAKVAVEFVERHDPTKVEPAAVETVEAAKPEADSFAYGPKVDTNGAKQPGQYL